MLKYKGSREGGETRTRGNKKDTKKWCKGVEGREHVKAHGKSPPLAFSIPAGVSFAAPHASGYSHTVTNSSMIRTVSVERSKMQYLNKTFSIAFSDKHKVERTERPAPQPGHEYLAFGPVCFTCLLDREGHSQRYGLSETEVNYGHYGDTPTTVTGPNKGNIY